MSTHEEPSQDSKQRERLLTPWHLVALALVAIATLAMLVPSSQSLSGSLGQPDNLSIKYLRLLVAARPQDVASKLQLARALLALRQLDEADQLLATINTSDPKLRLVTKQLRLEIHLAQLHDRKPSAEEQQRLRKSLAREIEELLAERLSAEELLRLAASSLALARPDLAARSYLHLSIVDPRQATKWLLLSAQHLQGSNQPAAEAIIYDQLVEREKDARAGIRYALLALAAFTRADQGDAGLAAVTRYLARYKGDLEILRAAARLALSRGRPQLAATYYDEVVARTKDPAEKLAAAKLALSSLSAAGELEAALSTVQRYLAALPDNAELLDLATRLGLAANRPRLSQKWGRTLLAQRPATTAQLAQQINIELAAGDVAAALMLARRLVAERPGSVEARERLAQIAEWNSQPREALLQYVHLALHTGKQKYLDRGLTLAPQLYEYELLAKLLAVKARRGRMSNSELLALVQAYENIGEPEELVGILDAYLGREPLHEEAWQALAEVHERRGDLKAALATWERKSRDFGSTLTELTHRAELLWQLHRPTEAYVLLRDALDHAGAANTHVLLTLAEQASREVTREKAPLLSDEKKKQEDETRKSYLKLLGELFWRSEPRPETLAEYRQLWRSEALQPEAVVRYVLLARSQGQTDEALAVAEGAFERFRDVEFLLSAMDIAVLTERWTDLGRLIKKAQDNVELLADNPHYYHLLAAYYMHIGDYDRVQRVYLRIIALDPGAIAARAELLWLLIDHSDQLDKRRGARNRHELARLLTTWRKLAEDQPSLWLPYATAYSMLGKSREAVAYYQREWTRRPLDHLWLLGYVSALDANSRSSDAHLFRRHALAVLRPDAERAAHARSSPAEREILNAYVELVRDVYGAGKGSRWLRGVLKGELEPEVQRGMLAMWRSTAENPASNYWVMDSRTLARTNPWGRFPKRPKPGQEQVQPTLADAGPQVDGAVEIEPPPAPLLVMAPDAAAGEDEVPEKGHQVSIEAGIKTINDLVVLATSLSARIFRGAFAVGGQLGVNQLFVDGLREPQNSLTEFDLNLYGLWRHRMGRLELGAGANLRSDGNLVSGWLNESLQPFRGGTLTFGVHLNELTYDSRWIRLNGARHRASVGLLASVFGNGLVSLQGNFYHYHTRRNDELAMGANGEIDLGWRIHRVRPLWTVRVSASYSHNFRYAATLPDFQSGAPATPVSDVLPVSFAAIGAGTRLEHRFPGVAPIGAGRWRYLADVWVGWLWPVNILGFEINAGVALGLPRRQELSLTGFIANNRWLGPGEVNAGLSLRYVTR